MLELIICLVLSATISIVISNVVGTRYLMKLDRDWERMMDAVIGHAVEEITKRCMH